MTTRRQLLPLCGLALLAACGALPRPNIEPDGEWLSRDIDAATSKIVRENIVAALERMAYPVGSGFDPVAGEIESAWQTHLGVFRGQGFRRMAVVRYTNLEPGRYRVEVRVKRQRNDAMEAPSDPSRAEWKWEDDDGLEAAELMFHVLSGFRVPLELGGDEEPQG